MIKVTLKGNLGKDPEMKDTKSGLKVCRHSVAVSRSKKVGDSYENVTDWFNVTWFNKNAETIHKNFWKGKEILIEATMQNNNYEKDGQMVYSDQIIGERFYFCGSKGEDPRSKSSSSSSEPAMDEELPF